jgi:hypothetical protein
MGDFLEDRDRFRMVGLVKGVAAKYFAGLAGARLFLVDQQRARSSFLHSTGEPGLCARKAQKSLRDGKHRRERLFGTVQRQRGGCLCASDGGCAAVGSARGRREKTDMEWWQSSGIFSRLL